MAEEVARDAVRDEARDFYWDKVNDNNDSDGDSYDESQSQEFPLHETLFTSDGISEKHKLFSPALPRQWLVNSFLEMYPPLLKSLSVRDSGKRVSKGIDELCQEFHHLLVGDARDSDEVAYALLRDIATKFDEMLQINSDHSMLPQDAFCQELPVEFEDEQYTTEKTIALEIVNDLELQHMDDLSDDHPKLLDQENIEKDEPYQPSAGVNRPSAALLDVLRVLSSPQNEELIGVQFIVRCAESGYRVFIRSEENDKLSPKIYARLMVLVAVLGYLLGDAMGCYQCLKLSIMTDEELLISRMLISSILVEMDEMDKVEIC